MRVKKAFLRESEEDAEKDFAWETVISYYDSSIYYSKVALL